MGGGSQGLGIGSFGTLKSYTLRLVSLAVIGAIIWLASGAEAVGGHGGEGTTFLLAFAMILLVAKAGVEVFARFNQPDVLGELVFGILLGNLGLIGLEIEALRDAPFLAVAAEIGVILLLFQVGLDSDLDELVKVGPSAITVAVIGVAAPLGLGFAVSYWFLPEDITWYAHLFVGATLSATSVGITARVLKDLKLTDKPESKLVLGAAVVDDILGLVILAFMLGLVRTADQGGGASFSLMPIILIGVKAVGFLAGAILMSRTIVMPMISLVVRLRSESAGIVLSVAYCFGMAAVAELIGLANIVGAFAAGLVLDRAITRLFGSKRQRRRIERSVAPIAAIFVPVFFVYMGMRVELSLFAYPVVLAFAGLLSVTAILSKMLCSLGVLDKKLNRMAVGVSMIPRGEVGLIFAGFGSSAMISGEPLFSAETFSAIVAMVMLTTLVTPPLIAKAFKGSSPGATGVAAGSQAVRA